MSDQATTAMPTHCTRYECCNRVALCEEYHSLVVQALYPPVLIRSPEGFMICPKCRSSYGRRS